MCKRSGDVIRDMPALLTQLRVRCLPRADRWFRQRPSRRCDHAVKMTRRRPAGRASGLCALVSSANGRSRMPDDLMPLRPRVLVVACMQRAAARRVKCASCRSPAVDADRRAIRSAACSVQDPSSGSRHPSWAASYCRSSNSANNTERSAQGHRDTGPHLGSRRS